MVRGDSSDHDLLDMLLNSFLFIQLSIFRERTRRVTEDNQNSQDAKAFWKTYLIYLRKIVPVKHEENNSRWDQGT